jgi:hypothetical protein
MKHFVWLSFDLGVKGDYEGMYRWLDSHKAKECGDSVACFWYEHSGELLQKIKKDLSSSVELNDKKVRIYVIRLIDGKMKGKFIFGNRRSAPWTGHAETSEESDDSSS